MGRRSRCKTIIRSHHGTPQPLQGHHQEPSSDAAAAGAVKKISLPFLQTYGMPCINPFTIQILSADGRGSWRAGALF